MPILDSLFPLWYQPIGPTRTSISECLVRCQSPVFYRSLMLISTFPPFPMIIQAIQLLASPIPTAGFQKIVALLFYFCLYFSHSCSTILKGGGEKWDGCNTDQSSSWMTKTMPWITHWQKNPSGFLIFMYKIVNRSYFLFFMVIIVFLLCNFM